MTKTYVMNGLIEKVCLARQAAMTKADSFSYASPDVVARPGLPQSEVDEGSVNVANRTVFTELGHRLADVDIQARKSIIEGNFLAAALGLRALVAVSTATSLYICLF